MNLEAARFAVTQSLMSNRLAAEKAAAELSKAETLPNVQVKSKTSPTGPVDLGPSSKEASLSSMSRSESLPITNVNSKAIEKPEPPIVPKEAPPPESQTPAKPPPEKAVKKPEVSKSPATSSEFGLSLPPLEAALMPTIRPPVAKDTSPKPSKPRDPVSSETGTGAGGNQEQDGGLITKATLSNSSNNVPRSGPDSSAAKANDRGATNPLDLRGKEREGKKERLLNRLRENKVALLTSDALAQMGCSGFGAKQKEVVSQVCNLL
jgi:hypothetical protein